MSTDRNSDNTPPDTQAVHEIPAEEAGTVSGEADPAPQARPAPPPPSRPPRQSAFPVILAGLALIVALLAVAFGWIARDQASGLQAVVDSELAAVRDELHQRTEAVPVTADRVASLQARIDQLAGELEAIVPQLESGVETRFGEIDDRLRAMHEALEKAMAPMHEPADVEHLLLIANDSLALQYDIRTALEALETADLRLAAIADPLFSDTRRTIAREINALKATPRPDLSGIAFTISGLQEDVEALTLDSLRTPVGERSAPTMTPAERDAAEGEGWRAMLQDLWSALASLVVVRRSDELEGPLLGPEQRVFLNQNLRQRLESARLSLLTRDEALFRHHLETVREWLETYYDTGDARVAALLERVDELAAKEIRPERPDISGSLQALREALDRRRAPILDDADDGQGS